MGHASRPHCLLVFDTCRLQRRRQGSLSLETCCWARAPLHQWIIVLSESSDGQLAVIFDGMFLRWWNSMFHRNLLSVTLAPQNAALSARNVGTDTADRTVSTHHLDVQITTSQVWSRFEFSSWVMSTAHWAGLDLKPQPHGSSRRLSVNYWI